MATLSETFTAIANAIRSKTGSSAKIAGENLAPSVSNIKITTTTVTNYKYVLTVNTTASASVSATKSGSTSKTATADSNGIATLTFTDSYDAGTWTITCTKNSFTNSTTKAISFS